MKVLFYISGHGYGHAARSCEVMLALSQALPGIFFDIRTTVPERFFLQYFRKAVAFSLRSCRVDTGTAQQGPLAVDIEETCRTLAGLFEHYERIFERENGIFAEDTDIIMSDSAFFPLDFARRWNRPSVFLGNFTWDWIYRDYRELFPQFGGFCDSIARMYRNASFAYCYPFGGGTDIFPHRADTPLVCRKPRYEAAHIRRRLGLGDKKPVILFCLGGFGGAFTAEFPDCGTYQVVTVEPLEWDLPGSLHITEDRLRETGLSVPDVVAASSLVVGKPGYGIVSECIASQVPFLYTSRGRFAEYPVMTRQMRDYLACTYISPAQLSARIERSVVETALAAPWPSGKMDCEGARFVASHMADRFFGKGF